MCICIRDTNLLISVCVSVYLISGLTSNLYIFLFFKFNKSEKTLSHRYVLEKGKIYLINQ